MQKEQSLAQKMLQSQQQFKNQFNPSHPSYHGGDQTLVPTGGDRVPESMLTIYPQGYVATQQQQEIIDYGEQYKRLSANRNTYQNLKKDLAKLGPIVESFLRHQQIFKQKADLTNEKHIKTHQQNVGKKRITLKQAQAVFNTYIPLLQEINFQGKETARQLNEIIFESGKQYANKQSLADFNFKCKKLSTKTFSLVQKYLQKLKDIKKEYSQKQKSSELLRKQVEKA